MNKCNTLLQAKDAIANLTADNVTHIGRVQFLEQKFSVALKEREQVQPGHQCCVACDTRVTPCCVVCVLLLTPRCRRAVIWPRAMSSGLHSSGWRWSASHVLTCR